MMNILNPDQANDVRQAANRIAMIAERMQSISRMQARNPVADAEDMIRQARAIIEIAERVKIANLNAPQYKY